MRRLPTLTFDKVGLALEVVVMLAVARLAVLLVPMATLTKRLAQSKSQPNRQAETASQLRRIGVYLSVFSRYTPWRSLCLEQALAAYWMLQRRDLVGILHLGVAKDGQRLVAHAWLECNGVIVTGARGRQQFTPVLRVEPNRV